jgi:hypothetical protein
MIHGDTVTIHFFRRCRTQFLLSVVPTLIGFVLFSLNFRILPSFHLSIRALLLSPTRTLSGRVVVIVYAGLPSDC